MTTTHQKPNGELSMLTHIHIDRDYPAIERNIPVPPAKAGKASKLESTSLLEAMTVGDSVWFPRAVAKARRVVIVKIAQRTGRKFITRTMQRDGKDGVRIWRSA